MLERTNEGRHGPRYETRLIGKGVGSSVACAIRGRG